MNYVTFKIMEQKDGEFVLYLHNHDRKKVFEQCRSKDIDEVIERLKKEMAYRKHFMNALGNMGIMSIFED
ncbi:MAG: hypothetical protein R6X10_02380 [Desulfobacterales bacterium]